MFLGITHHLKTFDPGLAKRQRGLSRNASFRIPLFIAQKKKKKKKKIKNRIFLLI